MKPFHRICRLLLLLLIPLPVPVHAEEPLNQALSQEQAYKLMQAVGQIYLREQMTLHLLQDCASEFNHLSESAERAKSAWQQNNAQAVSMTGQVQDYVTQAIQSQHSDFEAVKFTLDIETLIHNSVSAFRSELAKKNRKDRHYVCNRMILSVSAGEWNLDQQVPEALHLLSRFK